MVTIRCTVNKVEDGVAVCTDEEGLICDFPFYLFPEDAGEGSLVECVFEGNNLLSVKLLDGSRKETGALPDNSLRGMLNRFLKN